jgi:hypothetical protein
MISAGDSSFSMVISSCNVGTQFILSGCEPKFKILELVDSEYSLTQYAIENLDDAFESALLRSPPKTNSGLVELQAWLSKARQ